MLHTKEKLNVLEAVLKAQYSLLVLTGTPCPGQLLKLWKVNEFDKTKMQ